ncbi:MAG TPA: pyrimidine-nucleoside phosphorylase, partial [Clostridia bacterium]|nr:pyrimidine-nucleoside phosphorylase [Clostridia bacterium]
MRMVDLILKTRSGKELSRREIEFIVNGFVKGEVPDYQMAAWLMAVCFTDMTSAEIGELTRAMVYSGDVVDLSSLRGVKVDKHSTGGVGDTTTLVVAPLVAACGGTVAKMSGRGLGHTGGTLDKLESVPGLSVSLSEARFKQIVDEIGLC